MKWQRGHRSAFVEDRRGSGGGRLSLGGIVIALILYAIFGRDVTGLLSSGELAGGGGAPASTSAEEAELVDFVNFVLDDIQGTWERQFRSAGETYRPATLVLFTDRVQSACGIQGAAVGPFYCGADHKAYIDLGFYHELERRFGAPGDFAQAYVLAHEVGHHVQKLLGISDRVQAERARRSEAQSNALSVRQELQADCLAGVWAHGAAAQGDLLEAGDIDEGLAAAAAIGDDRLQREARGTVRPETFTHGSSEQRVRWFGIGMREGTVEACDTFGPERL